MDFSLVVTIKGREALPVRALCFVDGMKRLSPDLVAIAAAGESHYDDTWTLPTYRFSDGAVMQLKPSEWARISRTLKAISSRLKSIWGDADSFDLWRQQATPTLPAGVFVWLDEFMEWYRLTRPWKVEEKAVPEGDSVKFVTTIRPPWNVTDDDLLFYQRTLSESEYHMVLEGFPQAPTRLAAPAPEQPAGSDTEQTQIPVTTDGLVAWQAVMIESWPDIAKAHKGKPTPRNAMQWLKRYGPRDVIPEKQPDRGVLRWLDLSGNPKTVTLKTIQTRISEWRTAGIIRP